MIRLKVFLSITDGDKVDVQIDEEVEFQSKGLAMAWAANTLTEFDPDAGYIVALKMEPTEEGEANRFKFDYIGRGEG